MLILGYTTRDHLLLDLDETSEGRVIALARLIMASWPNVGDALVVESSTPSKKSYLKYNDKGVPYERWVYQNYHLVFDGKIGYDAAVAIIETLVELDVLNPEYKQIRMFRGDMTLRVSPKVLQNRTIPPPRILTHIRNDADPFNHGNLDKYARVLKMASALT